MRRYDLVTFDCYGTLIDWRKGMSDAFRDAGLDPGQALDAYHEVEPQLESESYRSYREVLTLGAMKAAQKLGSEMTQADSSRFAASLPSWPPFPDTNAALEKLRDAGYQLGILSNVDDDFIAETQKHFTVTFDLVITAQQIGSYKPAHAHFLAARERAGNLRWIHAAQSNFHDIIPTNALGIPNAWINRLGERPLPGGTPLAEFPDLATFAAWATQ